MWGKTHPPGLLNKGGFLKNRLFFGRHLFCRRRKALYNTRVALGEIFSPPRGARSTVLAEKREIRSSSAPPRKMPAHAAAQTIKKGAAEKNRELSLSPKKRASNVIFLSARQQTGAKVQAMS